MISDRQRAMNGVELAIRRVSDRLKTRTPWNMDVTEALDEIADEISDISSGSDNALPDYPQGPEGARQDG